MESAEMLILFNSLSEFVNRFPSESFQSLVDSLVVMLILTSDNSLKYFLVESAEMLIIFNSPVSFIDFLWSLFSLQ